MLKKSFWKNYFDVYDYLNLLIPYQDLLRQIVAEANIRPGDYVLDAGSGTGNLSVLLNNQRAIITAIDYSEDGHRLHVSKKTGANIIKTDLTDRLPFPDNYFDRICSNNTIYTIASEKRLQIFKEFLRVLKPGGVIVVSNVIQKFDPFKIYFDHLDQDIKKPHENPSIGILICKTKDDEVVKYALNRHASPTMIAEYETKFINKALLEQKIHELSQNLQIEMDKDGIE